MLKTGVGIVLIFAFALRVSADDTSELGKTRGTTVVPVSVLLDRLAKSPLGQGETRLLRAVADLVEKEQAAGSRHFAMTSSEPIFVTGPIQPMPDAATVPTKQPIRLWLRLMNSPAVEVAKSLEVFFDGEQKARGAYEHIQNLNRPVLVCEPVSNSLLVSATTESVDEVTRIILLLDTRPPMVMLNVCIAELLPDPHDGKARGGLSDASAADKAPSMKEDGAAWLAWAKKQGRLAILQRPQVMTLDNQPAVVQIGQIVPTGSPMPETNGPSKRSENKQNEVGFSVSLTPRISPEGLVFVAVTFERSSLVDLGRMAGPSIKKTTFQTTVSAKDGQTTIVRGLLERTNDGNHETIIAVTPHVNPTKR